MAGGWLKKTHWVIIPVENATATEWILVPELAFREPDDRFYRGGAVIKCLRFTSYPTEGRRVGWHG